jgi:hypothetical protein
VSTRAVARRAQVSPTAAGKAVEELVLSGRMERNVERVAMGRVRDVEIIRVARTELGRSAGPVYPRQGMDAQRARRVPFALRHHFWNTHPDQLNVSEAGNYIARRLIQTHTPDGLAWGVDNLTADNWEYAAVTRGLEPDLRQLALNCARYAT